jgi:hypothetical protein
MECNSWESQLNKFPGFYVTQRFRVPCLQEPATGPYNEQNESNLLEKCPLYNRVCLQLEHAHSEQESSSSFFLICVCVCIYI